MRSFRSTSTEIKPSDTEALAFTTDWIRVGEPGDLRVRLTSGQDVTLTNVYADAFLPICATHVLATGTTAERIVGVRYPDKSL